VGFAAKSAYSTYYLTTAISPAFASLQIGLRALDVKLKPLRCECTAEMILLYLLTICLQRAIELVEKAIFEDVKQNYAEAYKIYKNALDYFMLAHKCE